MPYAKLQAIGHYNVCRHTVTNYLYVSHYDRETRQTIYVSLRTKDMERAFAKVRDLVERGIEGDPRGFLDGEPLRTVRDVLEWHRPYVETLASAHAERLHIERLIRMMGECTMRALVRSRFDRFRDECLKEGIVLGTVSRILTTLRSGISRAVRDRLISRDIAPHVPEYMTKNHVRSRPLKGRVMEPAEIAAQIDAIEFPHVLIAEVFLLNTAARIGAILDCQALQIDLRSGLLHLNPPGRVQTTKWRPVLPLTETLRPWAEKLPPGYIVNQDGERVLKIDTAFAASCRRANLGGKENTYSLRHAIGRFMRSRRVPDEQIALWLGHIQPPENIETTLIYSPYDPNYLVDAKRAVEDFVRLVDSFCKRDLLKPFWV
jgi:integrase